MLRFDEEYLRFNVRTTGLSDAETKHFAKKYQKTHRDFTQREVGVQEAVDILTEKIEELGKNVEDVVIIHLESGDVDPEFKDTLQENGISHLVGPVRELSDLCRRIGLVVKIKYIDQGDAYLTANLKNRS